MSRIRWIMLAILVANGYLLITSMNGSPYLSAAWIFWFCVSFFNALVATIIVTNAWIEWKKRRD